MSSETVVDLAALREQQLALAIRGDRHGALREAGRALDLGATLPEFVFDVLAPVQSQVGLLWQSRRITTAQERMATEIAEILLTLAASRQTPGTGGANLVLCVADREHHNLPARMIAELLRLQGHRVTFLGSARPGPSLSRLFQRLAPDAIVLSCSLAMNLPALTALAQAAHDEGVPVLGGGRGFDGEPARAQRVGLQAHAAQIADVDPALERIVGVPLIAPAPADDRQREHAALAAGRVRLTEELVVRALRQAGSVLPRHFRDPRVLRELLTNLLRFVEAAVLCDDRIYGDYVAWLEARLHVQHAPAALLPALLDVVRERLAPESPLAARLVGGTPA